jgi:two-component system OmpR family response regulator
VSRPEGAVRAPRRPDGSPARLLVVDDEQALLDLLGDALRFAGYEVLVAGDGREALRSVAASTPDLVVLDVNLPDLDGFEVLRRLRAEGDRVPVVFLTARDDPDDLRTGFDRGGDDYVAKPFSLEELDLRIQAVLRRTLVVPEPDDRLRCGPLVMDVEAHVVRVGPEEVALSPTEFRLLRYLLTNRGRVLSKSQILDHVWDYDFDGDASVVETYISYLRRKLGPEGARLVATVRGVGYVVREPSERST